MCSCLLRFQLELVGYDYLQTGMNELMNPACFVPAMVDLKRKQTNFIKTS